MADDIRKEPQEEQAPQVQRNPLANLRALRQQTQRDAPGGVPVFWRGLILFSLILNGLLLVSFFIMGQRLFAFKESLSLAVSQDVQASMAQIETAQLATEVSIEQDLPLTLDVVIRKDTMLTLDTPVRISGATLAMQSGGFSVNGPATIQLPEGTQLPVQMDLTVPVTSTVPAAFTLPVQFDLGDTSLASAVSTLGQALVAYEGQVESLPGCWQMLLWDGTCP